MNQPSAVAEKPLSTINVNTNTRINFYTQGQQLAARVVLILWLLASISPEGVLAVVHGTETAKTSTFPDPTGVNSHQGKLTLLKVVQRLKQLTEKGQQLMQYAVYLATDATIPLSLVYALLEEDDPEQLLEVVSDLSRR